MILTKDFFAERGTEYYRYTATVEGKTFSAQHRQPEYTPGNPPLSYITETLKRQIMKAIENELFNY